MVSFAAFCLVFYVISSYKRVRSC